MHRLMVDGRHHSSPSRWRIFLRVFLLGLYGVPMDAQTLMDRAEITDLLTCYARAIDRHDWDLLRSLFTDDAHLDYTRVGGMAGNVAEVVDSIAQAMVVFEATQHQISNIDIEVNGDEAQVTAMLHNPLKLPDYPVWVGGGWYHHKLVRTAEGWRSRSVDLHWVGDCGPAPHLTT